MNFTNAFGARDMLSAKGRAACMIDTPWHCRATSTVRCRRDNGKLDLRAVTGAFVVCYAVCDLSPCESCFVIAARFGKFGLAVEVLEN